MGDPGGSWVMPQLGKNGRNSPADEGNGTRAPSRAAMQISLLCLGLAACSSLANPTHTAGAAAFPSPAFAGGCGETGSLLFPSRNDGASGFQRQLLALEAAPCSGKGGGSCLTDTPALLGNHIPARPCGISAHSWAWEHPGGGSQIGWVEGKGEEDVNLGKGQACYK